MEAWGGRGLIIIGTNDINTPTHRNTASEGKKN